MSYIFVSYSHKDKDYAHRLEQALKQRGFDVWLDDRIDSGTTWPKMIEEKLDGCKALILLMTVHSYDSHWVQSELSRAKRKRKNIFPLLLEGDEPWLSVEATKYVDVRGQKLPTEAFYDTLARVVPRKGVGASEQIEVKLTSEAARPTDLFKRLPASYRNPFELSAEYIHVPAGSFTYSVTKEIEGVPDIYFAKYPVTNRRYRRFISYLAGEEKDLSGILPVTLFSERMLEFAATIEGFKEYPGTDPKQWAKVLRSTYDQQKRFKGDDQPVVRISWSAARSYCFWLSAYEEATRDSASGDTGGLYRLPTEVEWEWAAGGGKREYPWAPDRGPPTDKLANYKGNVGATTAVGRYPDGATPKGLMDMAGNVWEWMENWHEEYEGEARCCRGGSWGSAGIVLRCSVRLISYPGYRLFSVGFRVVRSQS